MPGATGLPPGTATGEDEMIQRIRSDKPVTGSIIAGFDFNGRDLSDANLAAVELHTSSLDKANLIRVNLSLAAVHTASMKGAQLAHSDWTAATLINVVLEDSTAPDSIWLRAHAPRVKAARMNLERAKMDESVLVRADLSNASLRGASLRGARLDGAVLVGADLSGADLTGASLIGCDARGARFNGATVQKVPLVGADLTNADFTDASFDEVTLEGAAISNTKFPAEMRRTWFNFAARHHPLALYQVSVQNIEPNLDLIADAFQRHAGKPLVHLREDFAGGGAYAIAWARRNEANHGYAVELDPTTIAWGLTHNAADFNRDARKRLHMIEGNVLDKHEPAVDAICALNYSWCTFKDADTLKRYFETVHASLNDGGVFVLDAFGGAALETAGEWPTDHGAFVYVWHHEKWNADTRDLLAHMHFLFPDGSKRQNAFTYDWRVWTLDEIRQLLTDAGFGTLEAWTYARDEAGRETKQLVRLDGDPDPRGWSAYLVAPR